MATYNLKHGDRIAFQSGALIEDLGTVALADAQFAVVNAPAGVEPPPDPVPSPLNVLGVDLSTRPTSGPAWDNVVAHSKQAGAVTIAMTSSSTAGANVGNLIALALHAQRTANAAEKAKVRSIAAAALAPSSTSGRSLEVNRNLAGIIQALSIVGDHTLDARIRFWLSYPAASQGNSRACHEKRPNNWGTVAGLARVAGAAHLGDTAELAAAAKVHRGWLGERAAYSGFAYGDLSWQADPKAPLGINPKGATKLNGTRIVVVDGVLPEDQRRSTGFPTYVCENYVFQALGEAAMTQLLLRAAGLADVFSWSDHATTRAYQSLVDHGCKATGDDAWQYAVAKLLGVSLAHDGLAPGKSCGFVDWVYG